MKHFLSIVVLVSCFILSASAQKRKPAGPDKQQPAATTVQPATTPAFSAADRYIHNIYLKSYDGKEAEITDFDKAFYDAVENPYPYIYALWFNGALLGPYGRKEETHQLRLIDKLIADPKAHGTLVASAYYQKGMHQVKSNDFDAAHETTSHLGNICGWQYVGPFENLSHSGFYKDFGPLQHPEPKATFTSSSNAPVTWFTPQQEIQDGWTPVSYQIAKHTAVTYAQTFVNAPSDMDILCNVGATGAVKLWVNDAPVLSQYRELLTELDTYTVKAHLQKGTNRILVQLSYTNEGYANFSLRLTDASYHAIAGLSGNPVYSTYTKAPPSVVPTPIPHFAEAFFQDKIAREPANYINYLLLGDVYMRNLKTLEARALIEKALQQAPHNNLLRMKLIEVLLKEDNRSLMLEEVAKLKKDDPESLVALDLSIRNDMDNERYEDAAKTIDRREALYGEDATTLGYHMTLLIQDRKYEDLVALAERASKEHPDMGMLVPIMHSIHKDVYQDNRGAMKVYEDYLARNHDFPVIRDYITLLEEQGETEKGLAQRQRLLKNFPYDPTFPSEMASYYYRAKQYDRAEQYIRQSLDLSPYHEYYWEQLGDIKSERKQIAEAIRAYDQSLLYDPNQYTVINKIRKLKGKSDTYSLVPAVDVEAVIKQDNPAEAKNADYGFYVIRDEKSVLVHPGGATEEYCTYIVRITNEKGINRYKESSIGYGRAQQLLLEQTDLYKKSGTTIHGERNENQVVFTNLEVGDVLVFRYRLQNFIYGRFAKEFWGKYTFTRPVYTSLTRYNLLVPTNLKLNYTVTNGAIKPIIKDVEGFKQYTWEMAHPEPIKEEPYMLPNGDIAPVLHVSTVPAWQDIAAWYADIVNNAAEEGYELTTVFNTLLPAADRSRLSQFEQARRIYNYIEKNIRYSSVSFRQSAYVPQSASLTLTSRLGDCKDLSNLFATFCRMAGIECRLVLVDTRDNGTRDMVLPSMEFNHCIAQATLDGKSYYVELTDNDLPFVSLPDNLINALILEIPTRKGSAAPAELKPLQTTIRTRDVSKRIITIKPIDDDMQVHTQTVRYGRLSSNTRGSFANLDDAHQRSKMEKSIASNYKNNIVLESLAFQHLDELLDSVSYTHQYTVKDEIAEIGDLRTFKIDYPDIIAALTYFTAATRAHTIDYNAYEDIDYYETIVTVEAPAGKAFIELPRNEALAYKNMRYTLQYTLVSPGLLRIDRRFTSDRTSTIPASDYQEFKTFQEKIVKAELKMIAYK